MDQPARSFTSILRQPSAFLPLTMSLTALALVLSHIAIYGAAREADEGTTAHLWQFSWPGNCRYWRSLQSNGCPGLRGKPLYVLGLQAGAVLASIAPVLYFNL